MMYDKIHSKVAKDFDVKLYEEKFVKAQTHRGIWEPRARECGKVRENRIYEGRTLSNAENYDGKLYVDNQIHKALKWINSHLTGSAVIYDLRNVTSNRDENTEVLECELNLIASQLDIPKQTTQALYDCFYTGMGYVRRWWDKEAISVANESGEPRLEHVSTWKVYIDPTTQKSDKSDMKYLYHVEKYHYKDLIDKYPKFKTEIEGDRDRDEMVEIRLVNFSRTERVESITVTDNGREVPKKWIVPIDEWQDFVSGGGQLEDEVDISMPFIQKKTFWYEAIYLPKSRTVIAEPVFTGEFCSYHIFYGNTQEGCAYDLGMAHYMLDIQEVHVAILTTLVLLSIKNANPDRMIISDSLRNEDEYLENRGQVDNVAMVNADFYQNPNHVGIKPVMDSPPQDIPRSLLLLHEIIKSSQEDFSGVTKTMTGQPEYANMSGAAVSLHQGMGKVYHKEEQIKFQQKLIEIGRALMHDIAEYRDYPHHVEFMSDSNQMEMVMVNDPSVNDLTFEPERTQVFVEMMENLEIARQLDTELAISLYQMGAMSTVDMLDKVGINNPTRIYDAAMQEKGVNEIIEFLNQHPEYMEQLQQLMSGQMQAV